jgi:chromosome segregation ATPase
MAARTALEQIGVDEVEYATATTRQLEAQVAERANQVAELEADRCAAVRQVAELEADKCGMMRQVATLESQVARQVTALESQLALASQGAAAAKMSSLTAFAQMEAANKERDKADDELKELKEKSAQV